MSFVRRNHPQQTSKRGALDAVDDRRTTDELFSEIATLTGIEKFDLDPVACEDSARAPNFFTLRDDGLAQDWFGDVWLNPPYSDLRAWAQKTVVELASGRARRVVLLLPANRTEQAWWQDLIEPRIRQSDWRAFNLRGRRRFNRPGWTKPKKGDRPPFGLVVILAEGV